MERIVIMGLGNVLYGDEGLGVHAAHHLCRSWEFPEHVEVVDGGTQGHSLLTYVEDASCLLVLDAVDFGLPPGRIVIREGQDIPMYLSSQKISPHQNSFSEVLALAELRGCLPQQVVLVGMQPQSMKMGAPLSDVIRESLETLAKTSLTLLRRWGVEVRPTEEGRRLYHPALETIH